MHALIFPILASRTSGLGRLLQNLGVPVWVIWVLLAGWIGFSIYRRFTNSDE